MKLEEIAGQMKKMQENILPHLEKMVTEQKKLQIPISKKQIDTATVSLHHDAKVIFQFATEEEAKNFFNNFNTFAL